MGKWGIDSGSNVSYAIYDKTKAAYNKNIDFVGRYLYSSSTGVDSLSASEADWIHSKGSKIVPIYGGIRSSSSQTYEQGNSFAIDAEKIASVLGIPTDVAIFADIEAQFPVTSDFLLGWAEWFYYNSQYIAGFYSSTTDTSYFTKAYNEAKQVEPNAIGTSKIWTTYPQTSCSSSQSFSPYNPSGMANVLLYQYAEHCAYNGYTDLDMADNADVLYNFYMW